MLQLCNVQKNTHDLETAPLLKSSVARPFLIKKIDKKQRDMKERRRHGTMKNARER